MEGAAQGPDIRRIERLAAEMALTFNWISLYQEGHPSLAGRVEKLHRNLAEILNEEPSRHLLLGVAKDKILYRNVFLGQGNTLVRNFTSGLFLLQVATLDFSNEVMPRELLVFFLSLQRLRVEKKGGKLDEILKAEGVRGIGVYPYNYKEVLSRRILLPGEEAPSSNREDELWRMILTENVSFGDEGADLTGDLPIPAEMIPAILRRVSAAAGKENREGAGQESSPDAISPEMTRRVLARLGDTLRNLPVEQRGAIIRSLGAGVGDASDGDDSDGGLSDADIVRSLTGADSDAEFLDVLATLLAAEGKSGNRIRKIFEVIATERNRDGSLLPAVQGRVRESVRTKNYYARKAWEAIAYGRIEGAESAGAAALGLAPAPRPSGIMAGAAEILKDVLVSIATERKRSRVNEGRDIVSSIMKGLRQEGMLIDRLIRLQGHDDYTVTHSLNVCILVVAQAAHIGLPENRVREAGLAALLHDIGKETTPSAILTKPGRLDMEEFDLVKKHPTAGAKLLRRIDCGTELPMIVAFEHHIKYDRTGYPKVQTREPLHVASYMTQIADVYDALRSFRPYQPSIELERTLSIMKEGRGAEFEPRLYDNFVEILS